MTKVITIDNNIVTEEDWTEFSYKAACEWLGNDLACNCDFSKTDLYKYTVIQAIDKVDGWVWTFIHHYPES